MSEKAFFDAIELAHDESSGLPQAGAPGKLWGVVQGLWSQGVNPVVIINMISWIMTMIRQFSTLTIDELVAKVMAFLGGILHPTT